MTAKGTDSHPVAKLFLRLPDLDQAKSAVLNSLSSSHSRRNYKFAMEQIHHLVLLRATIDGELELADFCDFAATSRIWAWQLEP